jgi:hypothetical protein
MDSGGNLRELFLGLIVGMPCVGILNSLWFGRHLREYLSRSPRIETWQELERFKQVVSTQMYAALAQIGFLVIPYPAFAIGLYMKSLRMADIVYIIIPSVFLVVIGVIFKAVEEKAKSLPVSEELQGEYQRVINTWIKKPLPDW